MKILPIFDHVTSIIASILIILGAVSAYSWFSTGNLFQIIQEIPIYIWAICVVLIILWFLAIKINDRIKYIRQQNQGAPFGIATFPIDGWKEIAELVHKDVIWIVRVPKSCFSINSCDEINVDSTPRCPECKTKLEQSDSFFGGYIWKCVYCGFNKRNKDSWYKESERAKKIAQREFEKEIKNQN